MEVFLTKFEMEPITMYLICQLLDKLAVENCIDGYCLEYNIKDLTKELTKLIQKK